MPCNTCGNILTLSPSGQWLIFKGKDGLYVINVSTHQQQRITSSLLDAWPACSPDGTWLAYQSLYNTVKAVPSKDCLPTPDAVNPTRFINNISYSWRLGWSADGKKLTFLSNVGGKAAFYEIALIGPSIAMVKGIPRDTSCPWEMEELLQSTHAVILFLRIL